MSDKKGTTKSKTPVRRQDERRREVEGDAKAAADTTPVTGRQRAPPRDRSGGEHVGPPDDHEPAAADPPIAVTPVTDPVAPAAPVDAPERRGSSFSGRDGRQMTVETNDDDSRNEAGDRIGSSQSRSHHGKKRSTRAHRGEVREDSRSRDHKRRRHWRDSDSDSDTETEWKYRRLPPRGEREERRRQESCERRPPQAKT
jgi:hypothetical protein